MLAADFNHCLARLCLPKHPQNLLFAMTFLRHLPALLFLSREPRRPRTLNLQTEEFLGFGSERPVTSISSLQATWHCSIRSTMGRSPCPFLTRNLASSCSLTFPC